MPHLTFSLAVGVVITLFALVPRTPVLWRVGIAAFGVGTIVRGDGLHYNVLQVAGVLLMLAGTLMAIRHAVTRQRDAATP